MAIVAPVVTYLKHAVLVEWDLGPHDEGEWFEFYEYDLAGPQPLNDDIAWGVSNNPSLTQNLRIDYNVHPPQHLAYRYIRPLNTDGSSSHKAALFAIKK